VKKSEEDGHERRQPAILALFSVFCSLAPSLDLRAETEMATEGRERAYWSSLTVSSFATM
jgi:hypothetical protein